MSDIDANNDAVEVSVVHHGKPHTFRLPPYATVSDLSEAAMNDLSIPTSNQKFMITPKVGVLKPPFQDSDLSVVDLLGKKIVLIGSTVEEVQSLDKTIEENSKGRGRGRQIGRLGGSSAVPQPRRNQDWRKVQEEALYTFTTLMPLSHLPNPSRSLAVLQRLKDDAGIKATMRKHHWIVPLLTEMDPAEHTTHESKTLGLNRNAGEVIELRLRTDVYDGYRDYKSIRRTLCHELAHNVYGPHDSKFWALCKQIEQEVDQGDWRSGGHALSNEEFYEPEGDKDEHVDGGVGLEVNMFLVIQALMQVGQRA